MRLDLVTKRLSGFEDLMSPKPGYMAMLGVNDSTIPPLPPPPTTHTMGDHVGGKGSEQTVLTTDLTGHICCWPENASAPSPSSTNSVPNAGFCQCTAHTPTSRSHTGTHDNTYPC